jgi:hypothetical protein
MISRVVDMFCAVDWTVTVVVSVHTMAKCAVGEHLCDVDSSMTILMYNEYIQPTSIDLPCLDGESIPQDLPRQLQSHFYLLHYSFFPAR